MRLKKNSKIQYLPIFHGIWVKQSLSMMWRPKSRNAISQNCLNIVRYKEIQYLLWSYSNEDIQGRYQVPENLCYFKKKFLIIHSYTQCHFQPKFVSWEVVEHQNCCGKESLRLNHKLLANYTSEVCSEATYFMRLWLNLGIGCNFASRVLFVKREAKNVGTFFCYFGRCKM
jgi:hypothetical protein